MSNSIEARPDGPALQRKFIEDARALLKPSPVHYHKVPGWFRLALLRAFRGIFYRKCLLGWFVLDTVRRHLGLTWLKHAGTCDRYGKPVFVSEVYHIDAAELKSIEDLAAAIGCDWALSPNSWHMPGSTLRIVFFQREAK